MFSSVVVLGPGPEGWVTGVQIIDTTPPIPEPAGLGLMGLALLATRKRK